MKTKEYESLRDEMVKIMERLKQAAESLDAEGVFALCRPSEDFLAVIDGEISDYDQFVIYEREGLKGMRKHQLTFDSLLFRVLGNDTVAALALLHQVITDLNGVDIKLKTEFTWIATRESGGPLKLTYVHARHKDDPAEKTA